MAVGYLFFSLPHSLPIYLSKIHMLISLPCEIMNFFISHLVEIVVNLQQEQAHFEGEEGWEEESVSWISHCPDFVWSDFICKDTIFLSIRFFWRWNCWTLFCRADPFAKKDWYDIKAPNLFQVRQVGKTLVTRTQGTKVCMYVSECKCVLICIYLYKMYVNAYLNASVLTCISWFVYEWFYITGLYLLEEIVISIYELGLPATIIAPFFFFLTY